MLGVGATILLPPGTEPLFFCDSARNPAHIWTELSRILINNESAIISGASDVVQNFQRAFENKSVVKLFGFSKLASAF
jgi:predicted methyltransferase